MSMKSSLKIGTKLEHSFFFRNCWIIFVALYPTENRRYLQVLRGKEMNALKYLLDIYKNAPYDTLFVEVFQILIIIWENAWRMSECPFSHFRPVFISTEAENGKLESMWSRVFVLLITMHIDVRRNILSITVMRV